MDTIGPILSDAGSHLRPDSIGDIMIYVIFFGSIITLAFVPEGNDRSQYLLFGTIIACILDLLMLQEYIRSGSNEPEALFAFAVHIGMFVFPAICAGTTRSGKKKAGRAIGMSILVAVFGLMYAVMSFAAPADTYKALF